MKEHRLIGYVKPIDKTRYNSRVAEANADAQAATHRQAVSNNQAAAASQMAADGQTQGAAFYQQQAQNLDGATASAENTTVLGQARTIATTPATLTTVTGGTTNPNTGKTYTGAAGDRLNARLADIDAKWNEHAKGQGASLDIESMNSEKEIAIAEYEAEEAGRTEQAKRAKLTEDRNAASAGAAADSKKKTQAKGEEVPDTSKIDRISTILDGIIGASGDPMGPVYKEMMLQDFQDKEDAEQNAALSRDASIERAEDQNDDLQDLLDKYVKIHRENNDKYTAILDETRDSTEKYLAEQQERDINRLTWEQDIETQKLTRQKTQQLLEQSIQNALGGGAFSGAANEQLASTEREWDTAISNLAKEFSFKKTDVSAFYTQKYVDVNNQFNMDVFNAAKSLDEKIEGYSVQGFNSLQAMENAKTAADNEYRTTIDTAKKDYSTKISGYVKEMGDTLREKRRLDAAEKKAEEDRDWQERKFYENMDYQFEKAELADQRREQRDSDKVEKADEKLIRSEFTRLGDSPTVKDYVNMRNTAAKATNVLESALKNGKMDVGVAKEVVTVLYEKNLDPTSVVRIEEFKRAGLAQSVIDKAQAGFNALSGGDMSGLTTDMIKALSRTMDVMTTTQLESAQAEYVGAIIRMAEFNAQSATYNINPATLSLPTGIDIPKWAVDSYLDDEQGRGDSSWDRDPPPEGGGSDVTSYRQLRTQYGTSQDYDKPIDYIAGRDIHGGYDIKTPMGTALPAGVSGRVVAVKQDPYPGQNKGWGNEVWIKGDDGLFYRMAHLQAFKAKEGDIVTPETVVALSGNTGHSTGPHLHVEAHRGSMDGPLVDFMPRTIASLTH